MSVLRNSRQERYVQNWLKGETKEKSVINAGYQPKWAASIGSKLSINPKILARYDELQQKAEDASVATVLERKQILTEIARARMTDFMTCSAVGVWMHDIGPENLNKAGLKKVETTTMPFGSEESNLKIILTKVELIDSTKAIDLLNKMDKLYSDGINIDNRKQEIHFDVRNLTTEQLEAIIARYGNIGIPEAEASH